MIRHGSAPYLECSSKGDKRFSALYARIGSRMNNTIESIYQGAKVFADGTTGLGWREAKGKACVNADEVRRLYATLWDEYVSEHPEFIPDLINANGLSDVFGQAGHACQATELWRIRETLISTKDKAHMSTKIAFLVAASMESGLAGKFDRGPYAEFPTDDFATGMYVFKSIDEGQSRLAVEEMKSNIPANCIPAIITWRLSQSHVEKEGYDDSVSSKTLEAVLDYDFRESVEESIGLNDRDLNDALADAYAFAGQEPVSAANAAHVIRSADELFARWANEMKYETDEHQEVAKDIANWSVLRQQIWQMLNQHPAVTRTETPLERQEMASPTPALGAMAPNAPTAKQTASAKDTASQNASLPGAQANDKVAGPQSGSPATTSTAQRHAAPKTTGFSFNPVPTKSASPTAPAKTRPASSQLPEPPEHTETAATPKPSFFTPRPRG